jgi:protein-serine/threonine kinase
VIIKQVIKSRILADCWKKHPTHGTIPIEIYVMLALSSASYVLPQRRPWDRSGISRAERQERMEREDKEDKERADSGSSNGEFNPPTSSSAIPPPTPVFDGGDDQESPELATPEDKKPQTLEEKYNEYTTVMQPDWVWHEGKIVRAHPNICPLIDFFEDRNFYYLILPSTLPPVDSTHDADADSRLLSPPPKDLFDLVEQHPLGLPAHLVRSYLGQIADAMAFLHMRGIVHRDMKDENVVLSANGDRCWLIDFGSAGIVRRNGWNSFSGTCVFHSLVANWYKSLIFLGIDSTMLAPKSSAESSTRGKSRTFGRMAWSPTSC